jgi:hypothetical protein
MFIGSGGSFHNFEYIGAQGVMEELQVEKKKLGLHHSKVWNEWLAETLSLANLEERKLRLQTWEQCSSSALECHPPGL